MATVRFRTATWKTAAGSLAYPLIIAHRGDSSSAPENTLEAFRHALKLGVDGVELDVRLTRDREVVVIHDHRVDRTTDGKGPIGSFTLADARTLDAGSWFDPRFRSAGVPTLDEVFHELPPWFLVNVELKVRGTGVRALVSRVAQIIRRHRRYDSTLVASFNPLALVLLRLLAPRIARCYIWSGHHPAPLRGRWLGPLVRADWMDPDRNTFTPALLERFHKQGKRVLARDLDVGCDLARLAKMIPS